MVDRVDIKTVMLKKSLVFGGYDRSEGMSRNIFLPHPLITDSFETFVLFKIVNMPVDHERGGRCGHEFEHSHQGD